jgi:putative ABC transport system permease protein
MPSPRWKKLWRDLQAARGRMAMMVIAIAVSIFGVGTILSAYTILTREIGRNYLGTNPASAFIELDRADDSVVRAVKRRAEVLDAEATSWVVARVAIKPNEWRQLLLFVVKDSSTMRIDTFLPESGAWPLPENGILLEREALKLIGAKVGDSLDVQTPNGRPRAIRISGSVHDPGLAPAWQEEEVYGYVTPSTLAWLGESDTLHILKVIVKDRPRSIAAIDGVVGNLAAWLKGEGYKVGEIRVPPPGMHPHQSQMNSILILLLVFSVMALVLSAILTATMIGGLLAQQMRQIGIMKAIGARSGQIAGMYLLLILALGSVAVALGLPLGIAASRALAGAVAQLLNFTIYSRATPAWVYLVLALMGVLVPLLVSMGPIRRTTRTTVRVILNDYGTSKDSFGSVGLGAWLGRIRFMDNTLILALRNTFRRPGRLALTLGLLAAAGGMFMTGINVKSGWERFLADGAASRRYDLEIQLNKLQPKDGVYSTISAVPGVRRIESWDFMPIAAYRPDGLDIVRTYPDGGHGSFMLRSAPPESSMLDSPILSGRWLRSADGDGIVLNQLAAVFFPKVKVGDTIRLTASGRAASFRVVGLARQIMTPAMAYVAPQAFADALGISAQDTNALRIVLADHDPDSINRLTGEIGQALGAKGVSVKVFIPRTLLEGASDAHAYIFIYSLVVMAALMAVVGALGLMSSMGTSVIERTREFGVMRAIGAKSHAVLRNVISEGVFIGLMSWFIAVALSLPPSLIVDNLIGGLFSRVPLTLIVSPVGLVGWLLVVALGSIAASAYPAWQASSLTVRETLSYV